MPSNDTSQEWRKGMSKSTKSGLIFPVSRTRRYMKQGRYAKIIQQGAAVYLAAVLEYLVAEMVELSGNAARDNKKSRISPRFLKLAVSNDQELDILLGKVICPQWGVTPGIHPALLPSQSTVKDGKKKTASVEMRSKSKRSSVEVNDSL